MKGWKEDPRNYRPVVFVLEDGFPGSYIEYLPDEVEVVLARIYHPDFTLCLM